MKSLAILLLLSVGLMGATEGARARSPALTDAQIRAIVDTTPSRRSIADRQSG
jgi:hypothetical protein